MPGDEPMTSRRIFILGAAAIANGCASTLPLKDENNMTKMYGLTGSISAKPGERDALVALLLAGVAGMPGCLSYIVAHDLADNDKIWITEVWDSETSHKASLSLPSVQDAIKKARPIIAGMGDGRTTQPIGGHGLTKTQ
jgi:quinol monooxygenase YgiN